MKVKDLLESTPKASVAAVKKLYGGKKPWDGWASFKHRLIDAGIMKSIDDDCPIEWQEAFKKACGR